VIVWRQVQSAPYLKAIKIIDLGEQVMCMDLDKDMNLAIGAVNGVVKIISIGNYSVLRTFHGTTPLCTAVTLNQTTIEATIGSMYYTWDRNTGEQMTCLADANVKDFSCMKIDKSKRVIFTGSQDGKVRIYSWGTKPILLRQYGGHSGGVRCLTLQDNMLLTGSGDKVCEIHGRDLPMMIGGAGMLMDTFFFLFTLS
jgi:WD40 repeat protein